VPQKAERRIANPFNPLDWIKSAQDWFSRTERSSGFRPFLIFLLLVDGMALTLLTFFKDTETRYVALGTISISALSFIVLYFIKSFTDPNFCRSETHVERLRQLDREPLGSDIKQIDTNVIEGQVLTTPPSEKPILDTPPQQEEHK
jgi:hypothetical protein